MFAKSTVRKIQALLCILNPNSLNRCSFEISSTVPFSQYGKYFWVRVLCDILVWLIIVNTIFFTCSGIYVCLQTRD